MGREFFRYHSRLKELIVIKKVARNMQKLASEAEVHLHYWLNGYVNPGACSSQWKQTWKSQPDFFKFCRRFWKALSICLNLSHCLIVSVLLCYESFYGDNKKSFLRCFWNCLPLEFLLSGFIVFSYQRPLCWQRINDGYSTMSDEILDRIFLIVHRTCLLSYFRGFKIRTSKPASLVLSASKL